MVTFRRALLSADIVIITVRRAREAVAHNCKVTVVVGRAIVRERLILR